MIYSKRNFYLKKNLYGRNNKGIITVRGRKSKLFTLKKKIYLNYNYIYKLKNSNLLVGKIIESCFNKLNRQYIYKISILYNNNIEYKYIPNTKGLVLGDYISIGKDADLKIGNILPLFKIPVGNYIHNIESTIGKGSSYVKISKKSAFIINKGLKYVTVKLPSGEIRLLNNNLFCIFGEILINKITKLKKAGDSLNLGKKSKVRGVAMNACDHPHGGGEGKNSIGRKSPYTPWGKMFLGILTRKKNKYSTKYIISRNKND